MKRHALAVLLWAAALAAPSWAQALDSLVLRIAPEVMIPLAASADLYYIGGAASLEARLPLPSFAPFFPYLEVGYGAIPTPADKSLLLLSSGVGVGFQHQASPRVGLAASAGGGYYAAAWGDESAARFYVKGRAEAAYRFSPTFSVSLGGSYAHYLGPDQALYQGVGVALTGGINLGGLRRGTNNPSVHVLVAGLPLSMEKEPVGAAVS
jgi:hypothetical protein